MVSPCPGGIDDMSGLGHTLAGTDTPSTTNPVDGGYGGPGHDLGVI
jgi:hypothetical protein